MKRNVRENKIGMDASGYIQLLDGLPLPFFSCNNDGTVFYGNRAARQVFQVDIVGKRAEDLFRLTRTPSNGNWHDVLEQAVAKNSHGAGIIPITLQTLHRGGREIMCKIAFDPVAECWACVLLPGIHGILAALARIAESAVHAYHIDETLLAITSEARALTDSSRCYIAYRSGENGDELRALSSVNKTERIETPALPSKAGLITLALQTSVAEKTLDLSIELPARQYSPFQGTKSQIIVPLVSAERISSGSVSEHILHGVLVAECDTPLGLDAENVLETLAAHGAIAIVHAQVLIDIGSTYDEILRELRSAPEVSLVRNLIHDAKNLVRDAAGTVEIVQNDVADSPFGKKKAFDLIGSIDSLNDMKDLLNDMLVRFKPRDTISASKQPKSLDLVPLVKRIQRIVQGSAAGHVEILVSVDKNRSYGVFGERSKLLMILYNLTANAVNAIKNAGRPGKVMISLSDMPKNLTFRRIEITDTGPGMPRGLRSLVQGGQSVTRTAGGSGIGLLTVREMIKDLRGSISLDTRLGEGTRITLDLPGPEKIDK